MTRRSPGYVLTRRSPYPPPPSVTRLGERRGGCTFPSTFPSTFPRLSLDFPSTFPSTFPCGCTFCCCASVALSGSGYFSLLVRCLLLGSDGGGRVGGCGSPGAYPALWVLGGRSWTLGPVGPGNLLAGLGGLGRALLSFLWGSCARSRSYRWASALLGRGSSLSSRLGAFLRRGAGSRVVSGEVELAGVGAG